MQIETYEVTEQVAGDETPVALQDEAWLKLCEVLDLEGQRELTIRRMTDDGTEVSIRNPYRVMTQAESHVYSVLLPVRTSLTQFKSSPVPLRVLQVAAHAKQFFPYLEVWSQEDATKDPLLVGSDRRHGTQHMLARWGEELRPFEELQQQAETILLADYTNKLATAAEQIASLQNRRVELVRAHLHGRPTRIPYVNVDVG